MSRLPAVLVRAVVVLALAFAGLHTTAHASVGGTASDAVAPHKHQHSHGDQHQDVHEHQHANAGPDHGDSDCGGACCDVVCCTAALAAAAALPDLAAGPFSDLALSSQAPFAPVPDPHPPRLSSAATATA